MRHYQRRRYVFNLQLVCVCSLLFAFWFFDYILRSELSGWVEVWNNCVTWACCVRARMYEITCGMGLLPWHGVTCLACILATTEMYQRWNTSVNVQRLKAYTDLKMYFKVESNYLQMSIHFFWGVILHVKKLNEKSS